MRVFACSAAATLCLLRLGACQQDGDDHGLLQAIANYSDLSLFKNYLKANPSFVSNIVPAAVQEQVTLLIPNDDAFRKYFNSTGTNFTSLDISTLVATFEYHVLAAAVTKDNLTAPAGLVVPTLLRGPQYNNRTAGSELVAKYGSDAAQGQVLFASQDPESPTRFRIRRQSDSQGFQLRGGLDSGAGINPVGAAWGLGIFHIVDTILIPPAPCSNTIRAQNKLTGLGTALNRTDLWSALDHSPNVTCLAPTNDAFTKAGNPEDNLPPANLTGALLFHTLPMPIYSSFIHDGMTITSLANLTVTVSIRGNDIFFNDARVLDANVLTNNGLIHVLDRIMSPNGTAPPSSSSTTTTQTTTSPTATGSGSATGSPTPSGTAKPNAANRSGGAAVGGLLVLGAAVGMML